jgi:hypothetical protein
MLYREIIAFCSQIHTKHINTLCGQNVELLNVEPGGTYSDRLAVKCLLDLSVDNPVPDIPLSCDKWKPKRIWE